MTEAVLSGGAKAELVASYYDRYPRNTVIETGIWNGHGSTFGLAPRARIFAIESDPERAAQAYGMHPEIEVICGDSGSWLTVVLSNLHEPALFWLDAHTVAEAGEPNHSPLMAELDAILAWPHAAESVVLIDDVRMMGRDGWPTCEEVVRAACETWEVLIQDDVLRLTPP